MWKATEAVYHVYSVLRHFVSSLSSSLFSSPFSLSLTVPAPGPSGKAGGSPCAIQFPSSSKNSCILSAVIHPELPSTGGGRSPLLEPSASRPSWNKACPCSSVDRNLDSSSSSSPGSTGSGCRFEQADTALYSICVGVSSGSSSVVLSVAGGTTVSVMHCSSSSSAGADGVAICM